MTWLDLNSILVCLILPAQRFWIPLLLLNLRSQNLKLNHGSVITSDCLANFQKAVKFAKSKYFSNLIAKNHHSSKGLFSVLNSVLNPHVNVISKPSVSLCEGFSRFFSDKITTLRSQLQPLANVSPEFCCSSAIWSDLDQVSLQSLKETMDHLKPSFCSHDVLPPRILKQIFDSVGPSLVSFLNKSLVSGTIPDSLN